MKKQLSTAVAVLALAGCSVNIGSDSKPSSVATAGTSVDSQFREALDQQDIHSPIEDVDEVFLAKDICNEIRQAGTVEQFFRTTLSENPDLAEADRDFIARFTGVAVVFYCPGVPSR